MTSYLNKNANMLCMVCSSEVRAAAAIAEDVGFDSLPCPQFSDSFRNWCHYCARIYSKTMGLHVMFCCSYTTKNAGEEDSLLEQPTISY